MPGPSALGRADAATPSPGTATDGGLSPMGGDRCKICDIVIPRGSSSVTAHFASKTHQARARQMGVYCACGRNFLNPDNFPHHKCMSPSVNLPGAPPREFSTCQICGMSVRSQDGLTEHKDYKQHLEIAHVLGYRCACVKFFLDFATMERHKCFDKAIRNQTGSMGSGARASPRLPLNCTGCDMGFLSEKEFFAHHEGHSGVHSPVWTKPPEGVRAPISTCRHCRVDFYQGGSSKAHRKMQSHIDLLITKGLYCLPCKRSFVSVAAAREHQLRAHDQSGATEFRCCDCQKGFRTNKLLKKHACPWVPPQGYHACEPCNLRFPNKMMMLLHLNSKNHKPVKCLGGGGCSRKFKDLPGMLQHLESGSCKSRMNRRKIDALLRKHDTGNIITIEGVGGAATPAALPSWSSTSHISSASAVLEEVDADSEDEDGGGVIFTPTSTPPRRGSVDSGAPTPIGLQTPTTIDSFTRTLTPLSGGIRELNSRLGDLRTCPICSKKFNRPGDLALHIASPVHAVPKYHCPKGFLEEMGMKMDRHGVERTFKTLSGLAQHIHVRACTTDKDAWVKMVRFLEEKLGGLGYDGVRLLSQ